MHSEETLVDLKAGRTLGRYRLVAPIASGGMARVWAARLSGLGGFSKLCALKIIRPEIANDQNFRTMFLDEARIAARIRHRNACETYDVGEADGVLFIAMEWVEGVSLIQLLRKGPATIKLSHEVAARIISDACAGLHAAHELVGDDGAPLHVVHRDISPHNVLVASDGIVKLTDFGVAKAEGREQNTQSGELKGKLLYMSPEQLTSNALDRRSDVFSMGIVLYESTTGVRPFGTKASPAVVRSLLEGRFTRPSALDPKYPAELEAIVVKALSVDPTDRFQTADLMRESLERWLVSSAGGVPSSRVAEVVRERCGPHMDEMRRKIGQPLEELPPPSSRANEVTDTLRDSSGSSLASSVVDAPATTARATRKRMSFGVLAAMGAAVGILGGIGIVLQVRHVEPVHTAALPAVRTMQLPAVTSPVVNVPAPPTTSVAMAAENVTFQIIPKNAVLAVDGVTLPIGITAVQAPTIGTRIVRVHATGYEDRFVTIDSSSPAIVSVQLVSTRTKAAVAATGPVDPAALPNPYEQ